MTSLDLIALGIVGGSILVGVMRGFVRESFSLGAWVIAFFAAKDFSQWLAPHIPGLSAPALRYAAAMALVFVTVLILASLLSALLRGLISSAGMGGYDRMLGGFFGLARALVVLLLLTYIIGLTAMPRTDLWQMSLVHAPLEFVAALLAPWLPQEMASLLQFTSDRK